MMSLQMRRDALNSSAPQRTPRLRLKPKAPRSGHVDGAWWPHTNDLTAELPDLLAVLSVRLGHLDRVLYDMNFWAGAPRKFAVGTRILRLDGYRRQPMNSIEVLGLNGGRIVLLVVPPHTDAADAHTTMMTAAHPDNATTVDALLADAQPERIAPMSAADTGQRWAGLLRRRKDDALENPVETGSGSGV